jgi:hypothetical protein
MMERVKITVRTADGEPFFIVDKSTTAKEIEEYIKAKYGVREESERGKPFKRHLWTAQKTTLSLTNDRSEQRIEDLKEDLDLIKKENTRLRRDIRNLNKCLVRAHTKICYIDRTLKIDWISNHPSGIDITCAKKKIEEILIKLGLEDFEKEVTRGPENPAGIF